MKKGSPSNSPEEVNLFLTFKVSLELKCFDNNQSRSILSTESNNSVCWHLAITHILCAM